MGGWLLWGSCARYVVREEGGEMYGGGDVVR